MNKKLLLFVSALIVLEFFSFGLTAGKRGFYHDDWVHLDFLSNASAQGALDTLRVHLPRGHWSRPVLMAYIPLFYSAGGLNPAPYQAGILLFECLTGLLLFFALREATRQDAASWIAAAVFLVIPNRACTHFWWIVSVSSFSTMLTAAAFYLHVLGVQRRGRSYAWMSASCYLLAMLTYEATMGWIAWIAVYELWRRKGEGILRENLFSAGRAMLPYAAAFSVLFLYQRVVIPALLPESFAKHIYFSPRHFIVTYVNAAYCVTVGPLAAGLSAIWWAIGGLEPIRWALLTAAGTAAVWAVRKPGRETADAPEYFFYASAAVVFVASYAPYAVSGQYAPDMASLMSRINTGGAFAAGLAAAGLFLSLSSGGRLRIALRNVLFPALLVLFSAANWKDSDDWEKSWRLQRDVMRKIAPHVAGLPARRVSLLLAGVPNTIGTAVVFDSYWDFAAYLRVATGRRDLDVNVISRRIVHDGKSVREESGGQVLRRHAYDNLWVYRYDLDRLIFTGNEPAFREALAL